MPDEREREMPPAIDGMPWESTVKCTPETFLDYIADKLPHFKEVERDSDMRTGRRFNTFDLFNVNEEQTSKILKFLLDPNGAHGQGGRFLRLFIKRFIPDWEDFNCDVARMEKTDERIDVTISDGSYWLGIENKIFYAVDQPSQMGRYLSDLASKHHKTDYRIIYLSPIGDEPSNNSLSDADRLTYSGHYICGAWVFDAENRAKNATNSESVLGWLSDCQNECHAENVRLFIKQFSDYVRSRVTGNGGDVMPSQAIVNMSVTDVNHLEAALVIGESVAAIRQHVISRFLMHVRDQLISWASNRDGWEVIADWPGGNWIKDPFLRCIPILLRRSDWPRVVGVGIWAETCDLREIAIFIVAPRKADFLKERGPDDYGPVPRFLTDECIGEIRRQAGKEFDRRPTNWNPAGWSGLHDGRGGRISDWTDRGVLVRLHGEADALCCDIVAQIERVAGIMCGIDMASTE